MAYNITQNGNSRRISLGTGVLLLKEWGGTTPASPTDDIGYGRGAQLQVTRERVEFKAGAPRTLVVQYAIEETANLQFTSVEWNGDNLARLLGYNKATAVTGTSADKTVHFGGSLAFQDLQLTFVHQMPAGGTVTLDFWKAQTSGELTLNWQDDIHEMPFNLRALFQTTNWGGTALASDRQLFRLRIEVP